MIIRSHFSLLSNSAIIGLLLVWSWAASHAQTVAEVPQALIIRSAGIVQVVSRDGLVRDAFVTPSNDGKPLSLKGKKERVSSDLTPEHNTKPADGTWPLNAYLFAGEILKTGRDGSADLALVGAGSMRVEADSEVKLTEKKQEDLQQSLELLKGRLFISIDAVAIKKQGNQEFRLKTPAAILAVKGTKFFASSAEGTDVIGVHHGEVSVTESASKKNQPLTAGNATEMRAGKMASARTLNAEEQAWNSVYADFDMLRQPFTLHEYPASGSGQITWEKFFWKMGRPSMDWLPDNIESNSRGWIIKPLPARNVNLAPDYTVAGILLKYYFYSNVKKDLDPAKQLALEFEIAGKGLTAVKILNITKETPKALLNPYRYGTSFGVRVNDNTQNPIWKSNLGFRVPLTENSDKPDAQMQWTRVQIESGSLHISGEIYGLFVLVYPRNKDYMSNIRGTQNLELYLRDVVAVVRKEKQGN